MKFLSNKLIENIFSLLSLKGIQYVLNFLLLPYLLYTIGANRYGAIVFIQSIVQYFVIIIDYGFNMTGPKDISRATCESERNKKFSVIIAAKMVIFVTTVVLFFILNYLFEIIHSEYLTLFAVSFLIVIGNIIFPVWFFQGIQEMRYITLFNFIAKVIVVASVFLFVKQPEDYLYAAFFQSSEAVISGICSLYIIRKRFTGILTKVSVSDIEEEFVNGWSIFLSTIAINIYTTSNIVFLGMLTNTEVVGYFSAANKIIDAIKGLMVAVTQAVYPHVSSLVKTSKNDTLFFLNRFSRFYVGGCLIGGIILFLLAGFFTRLLFGDGFEETALVLKILSLLPFVISISNVYGIQLMINFGEQGAFSKILCFAAILDLVFVYPMIMLFQGIGIAFLMLGIELFISVLCVFYVTHYMKISLFNY